MNSREKGKRGERQWRDELRAQGFQARRGQQFSGSVDSPDVVCEQLRWIHFEVKAVEKLNVQDAMDQAGRDCGGKVPIVAHRRSFRPWLVTMEAGTFFRLLRGDFGPKAEMLKTETLKSERAGLFTTEAQRAQRKDGTLNRNKNFNFNGLSGPEKESSVAEAMEDRQTKTINPALSRARLQPKKETE